MMVVVGIRADGGGCGCHSNKADRLERALSRANSKGVALSNVTYAKVSGWSHYYYNSSNNNNNVLFFSSCAHGPPSAAWPA